jgi:hypothetical protein
MVFTGRLREFLSFTLNEDICKERNFSLDRSEITETFYK